MTRLVVELDPPAEEAPGFGGDTAPIAYFLSFAFAARYGARHELARAALRLREQHKIDLKPLLTFADRSSEDEADRRELERLWQEAGPLADCCRRAVGAIDADEALRELLREQASLRDRLADLGEIASRAAAEGRRMRLTYELD